MSDDSVDKKGLWARIVDFVQATTAKMAPICAATTGPDDGKPSIRAAGSPLKSGLPAPPYPPHSWRSTPSPGPHGRPSLFSKNWQLGL